MQALGSLHKDILKILRSRRANHESFVFACVVCESRGAKGRGFHQVPTQDPLGLTAKAETHIGRPPDLGIFQFAPRHHLMKQANESHSWNCKCFPQSTERHGNCSCRSSAVGSSQLAQIIVPSHKGTWNSVLGWHPTSFIVRQEYIQCEARGYIWMRGAVCFCSPHPPLPSSPAISSQQSAI